MKLYGFKPIDHLPMPTVCKAIYGVRFLFALCVTQHHIGIMPWKWWARIQSTSFNMTYGLLVRMETYRLFITRNALGCLSDVFV